MQPPILYTHLFFALCCMTTKALKSFNSGGCVIRTPIYPHPFQGLGGYGPRPWAGGTSPATRHERLHESEPAR